MWSLAGQTTKIVVATSCTHMSSETPVALHLHSSSIVLFLSFLQRHLKAKQDHNKWACEGTFTSFSGPFLWSSLSSFLGIFYNLWNQSCVLDRKFVPQDGLAGQACAASATLFFGFFYPDFCVRKLSGCDPPPEKFSFREEWLVPEVRGRMSERFSILINLQEFVLRKSSKSYLSSGIVCSAETLPSWSGSTSSFQLFVFCLHHFKMSQCFGYRCLAKDKLVAKIMRFPAMLTC